MSVEAKTTQQAAQEKFESQVKTAETKLNTLKAKAEAAKASIEVKAIADLTAQKTEIQQKLQELKKSGGEHAEHAKANLDARIAALEKSLRDLESKLKAS